MAYDDDPGPACDEGPLPGWLCGCGEWNDHDFHCDCCLNEPPWGCDCALCNDYRDGGYDDDCGEDFLDEDYP